MVNISKHSKNTMRNACVRLWGILNIIVFDRRKDQIIFEIIMKHNVRSHMTSHKVCGLHASINTRARLCAMQMFPLWFDGITAWHCWICRQNTHAKPGRSWLHNTAWQFSDSSDTQQTRHSKHERILQRTRLTRTNQQPSAAVCDASVSTLIWRHPPSPNLQVGSGGGRHSGGKIAASVQGSTTV